MRSPLSRLAAFFLEAPSAQPPPPSDRAPARASRAARVAPPPESPRPEPTAPPVFLPPAATTRGEVTAAAVGGSTSSSSGAAPAGAPAPVTVAAILGAPAAVVPVAAACAGELRARAGAPAALVCIWRPGPLPAAEADGPAPPARSPAGATTPGARRLAARLAAHQLPATACGRLAWLALEDDPAPAASSARRCVAIAAVPVVLAIAGPRPPAFEPLLAEVDVAFAVLPPDIDHGLRDLALATLRAPERAVVAPLAAGPPRWAAMAGLARLRSLPREAA